jgi:lipoyl(octanoyl) transferase
MQIDSSSKTRCDVYHLGTIEYSRASQLQEQLLEACYAGQINDLILILEHYPVLTIGKSGCKPEHIRVASDTLDREGISICHTNRGGGITCHAPGQLVCYPIFNLRNKGITVRQYIHYLEEVIINSLAYFDISAQRSPHTPGVWVDDKEIASIGIHVSRGITTHGFTINVNNEIRPFSYIAPCGVQGKKFTSVARIAGTDISVEDFISPLRLTFHHISNLKINQRQFELLNKYYD